MIQKCKNCLFTCGHNDTRLVVASRFRLHPTVYAKSSEVLLDICQTDLIFLQGRMKICRTEKNTQFAKMYSERRENENEVTVSNISLYLSFVSFFAKILVKPRSRSMAIQNGSMVPF